MKEQLVKQKTSLKLAANENHQIIETNRETLKKFKKQKSKIMIIIKTNYINLEKGERAVLKYLAD